MIRLPTPQLRSGDVFAKCISANIRSEIKARLEALQEIIEEGDDTYHESASAAQLFTIQIEMLPNGVSLNEIRSIYTYRFQPKDSLGREIYDQLILAAENRTCPLCGIGLVESLDHYLPKQYWQFIVSPRNLVPSCLHCNYEKREHSPDSFETQTIHPYYDDFQTHTWLTARIIEDAPPGVVYEVTNLDGWDPRSIARACTHFEKHNLAILFASNAGNELSQNKQRFKDLYEKGGPDKVREHLLNELRYTIQKNHWKTALYSALSTNDWFIHSGCIRI